jgi:predicted amidophosphoribosyltransferase
VSDLLGALVDLALPADCAGCGASAGRGGLCLDCVTALVTVEPQRVRPTPEPPGMPRTVALAAYAGALRSALLGYKEKGRHALVPVLGDALARVVARGIGQRPGALLVPVPATTEAMRRRYGDHVSRLASRAARTLCRDGVSAAVVSPLRARPRVDSAELSAAQRLATARAAFTVRVDRLPAIRAASAAGAAVVLVDDIVTTGATLAAATALLRAEGVEIAAAAVLAATQRRAVTA